MCVAENTLRGVSVELSAVSGQPRRRTQRSFFDSLFRPERINSPACFGHAIFYSSKVFSSSSISSPKRARAESTGPAVLISTPAIFSRDIGSSLLPAERKRL